MRMLQPWIRVVLSQDNKSIIVNQCNISYIERINENDAILHMNNGEKLSIIKPTFNEWENDVILVPAT